MKNYNGNLLTFRGLNRNEKRRISNKKSSFMGAMSKSMKAYFTKIFLVKLPVFTMYTP